MLRVRGPSRIGDLVDRHQNQLCFIGVSIKNIGLYAQHIQNLIPKTKILKDDEGVKSNASSIFQIP